MKNLNPKIFIVFLLSLVMPIFAHAGTTKVITLKDGTVLKGTILQLNNDIYTIDSTIIGQINIPDSDILSIQTAGQEGIVQEGGDASASSGESPIPLSAESFGTNSNIKNQVQQMQGAVMSDPNIMMDIQGLMEDDEIKAMLSDQNFVNDIMSYDPSRIGQNEKTQVLMQNPKMQALMEKIQQKVPPKE